MGDKNKVLVKIYGQEYTISGDMPREHIMRVADYVDAKIREVAKAIPTGTASSLAVLAAVNAADDYFRALLETNGLKAQNMELEKDTAHYVQLWDEAKKNFLQYKEDTQNNLEQREQLQRLYNEKTAVLSQITRNYDELQKKYDELLKKQEALVAKSKAAEDTKLCNSNIVKELEIKCRDVESSFFDLQMENIQLKGELDRYKKMTE